MEETSKKTFLLPEDLAVYVKALKLHARRGELDSQKDVKLAVESMPSPVKITKDFSIAESKALYETVGWAWTKITGQDILEQRKLLAKPEKLSGNYWFINGGILFGGPNHFTIIKKNMDVFASILNIDPFTIHEQLCMEPNILISTVINAGGVRVFINNQENSFFQMTSETYRNWGKRKVYSLNLKDKTVRLIDPKSNYIGWKSGIPIRPK